MMLQGPQRVRLVNHIHTETNCIILWIARLARDPLLVSGLLLPVWCVGARTRFLMTRCTIPTFVNVFAGNLFIRLNIYGTSQEYGMAWRIWSVPRIWNGLNWRIQNTARITMNACLHYTVLQDTLEHANKTG